MNLKPDSAWYLDRGGQRQVLYYSDWPSFKTKYEEKVVRNIGKNKTVLKPAKTVWNPICVEMPTRLTPVMNVWMENPDDECDVIIIGQSINSRIVQEWRITGAKIIKVEKRLGRVVNINILSFVFGYSWAGRIK